MSSGSPERVVPKPTPLGPAGQPEKNGRAYHPPYHSSQWPASLAMFDLLQTPLWIYDYTRWRQYYINRAAMALWGCATADDFLQRDFRDNSEATDRYLNSIAAKFLSQRGIASVPPTAATSTRLPWTFYPNGVPFYCHCAYSPYWLEDGRLLLIVEATPSTPPVAETSRAVEALRHVSTRVTVYDAKGYILYQNPSGMAHLVLTDGRWLAPYASTGNNVESLLTEHSFLPHWASRNDVRGLLEILAAGKEACVRVSVKLAVGERYHLVHAVSALDPAASKPGDRVIVVAEEDITQQVREQEELVTQRIAAQLMDDFLKITSHELKTPLHGITGVAEQLLSDTYIAAQQKASVGKIITLASDLDSLVTNILEFKQLTNPSNATPAGNSIEMTTVCLFNTVGDIVLELLTDTPTNENTIDNLVLSTLFVSTHEPSLRKALRILIGNALKFTTKGKVTISATADEPRRRVVLTVADTGIGISPDFLPRLFTPFRQAQSPCTRRFSGSGISLALAKKYVGLCNGDIWAQSDGLNQGSKFCISLPAANTPPTLPAPTSAKEPPVAAHPDGFTPSTPVTILSVDDDPVNQLVVKSMLSHSPWRLQQAMSGQLALQMIQESRSLPNLILLDIMMPDMSGYEVAEIIQQKFSAPAVPIVALSATAPPDDLEKYHFKAWIRKPFKRVDLLRTIQHYLSSSPSSP